MWKITKWRILQGVLCLAVILSILVSALNLSVAWRSQDGDALTVGADAKVITIGIAGEVYAAGTPDYSTDGVADDVQFQLALNALPANGGKIVLLVGNYSLSANVTRALANVTWQGMGRGSYIALDGVNPTITAGGNNWVFQDLRTDAGGFGMGATTGWMWTNVTINATYWAYRSPYGTSVVNDLTAASVTDSGLTSGRVPIAGVGGLLGDDADLTWSGGNTLNSANATVSGLLDAQTGRGATLVVAANDATALVKAQADYVADGTADDVEIQAAIDALPAGGGKVVLSEGGFTIAATIFLKVSYTTLEGSGWNTQLYLANNVDAPVISVQPALIYYSHLRNFRVNGNKANNVLAGDEAAVVFNVFYGTVENLYVQDSDRYGIFVGRSGFTNVLNNWIYGSDNIAIYVTTDSYGLISGNRIQDSAVGTESAIRVGSDKIVTGNTILGGGFVAQIDARQYGGAASERVLIQGNELVNGVGMGIAYFSNSQVSNNHIVNVAKNAIDSNSNGYNVIANNKIKGVTTPGDAAGILTGSNSIVTGNIIEGTEDPALWIDAAHDNLLVDANEIIDAGDSSVYDAGILVVANAGNYPDNLVITNNRVSGPQDYGIILWTDGTTLSNAIIANNNLRGNAVAGVYLPNLGVNNEIKGNLGYSAPGETRYASGTLTAGVANAITFAWHNPEAQDILVKKVVVEITTGSVTAGSEIDVGIADDAAGTNRGTEFFNNLDANDVDINDSWVVGDGGTQTKWVFAQDSASATDGWVVGQILTADAAALVGRWYIEFVGR